MTITRTSSKSLFGNLRRMLLEAFLFDSIIQDVLLQVLSIDAPTLEVSCFLKSLVKVLTFLQLKVFCLGMEDSENPNQQVNAGWAFSEVMTVILGSRNLSFFVWRGKAKRVK
jgi:hypothetical protein